MNESHRPFYFPNLGGCTACSLVVNDNFIWWKLMKIIYKFKSLTIKQFFAENNVLHRLKI